MYREQIARAADFLTARCDIIPDLAIIFGSGLGDLAHEIKGFKMPYEEIPGFPTPTAPSHKGVLHIGTLAGCKVVAMQGRIHMYEGYTPQEVTFPVHVMSALGAKIALLTNAAGAINPAYMVADLALVEDHLSIANLGGADPLRGPNDEDVGPRFTSMNGAYSKRLRKLAKIVAQEMDMPLRQGVYAFVTGPTFETPAEIRGLRLMGGDLVGMSTVPEVIAARYLNMEVIAISAVTNIAVHSVDDDRFTTEEDVWGAIDLIKPGFRRFIFELLPRFPLGGVQ